ncbi:MAG: hypothetical protein LC667_16660, partial [Thioalkalivibrio sp.]|nr:hypothetical protein [Thioalkalivibrio sp.]
RQVASFPSTGCRPPKEEAGGSQDAKAALHQIGLLLSIGSGEVAQLAFRDSSGTALAQSRMNPERPLRSSSTAG